MKKIKSRRGFSFVEMLVTLLILCLVFAFISESINVVYGVYNQSIFEADSQVLSSTIEKAIEDILRYSRDVSVDSDSNVTALTNTETYTAGTETYYKYGITGGNLLCESGIIKYRTNTAAATVPLISAGEYGDMTVTDFKFKYDTSYKIFTYGYTIVSSNGKYTKKIEDMKVRAY